MISKWFIRFTIKIQPMRVLMIIGVALLTLFSTDIAAQSERNIGKKNVTVGLVIKTADLDASLADQIQQVWDGTRQEGIRQNIDPSTLTRERRQELQRARFNRFLSALQSEGLLTQEQFNSVQARLTR